MTSEKGIGLAILGVLAVVLIAGLILLATGETTGQVYKKIGRRGCFINPEDACSRTMHCDAWERGVPADAPPLYQRTGYVACECTGKHPENYYQYVKMCA